MTRRLLLLRHAKSSWDSPDQGDYDRPLNARGRSACDAVGPWLAERGYVPDQILCSSAARTRETWERLASHLPSPVSTTPVNRLYLAPPAILFDCLSHAEGQTVAVLAHNPGIGDFAHEIVQAAPAHPGFGHFPTLATLIVDFAIDQWSDLALGHGIVVDFIVPRDLTDH